MSEHDQIEIRMTCSRSRCRVAKSSSAIARRVRSACLRAPRGETRRDIRVNPAKRANRERIAKDATQRAVTPVLLRPQAVSVLDVSAPSRDVARPRAQAVVDAHVLPKHVAAPAIMIARDHHHGNTRFGNVGQGSQRSKPSTRDYRSPLEPELEQVAVDDERTGVARRVAEKRDDRLLNFRWREAEVRVGDDIAGCVEHARILPTRPSLYKRSSLDDPSPRDE